MRKTSESHPAQYHDIYVQDQESGFFHQIITNNDVSPGRAMVIAEYVKTQYNLQEKNSDYVIVHPATEQEMVRRKMELAKARRVRVKNERRTAKTQNQTASSEARQKQTCKIGNIA